MTDEQLFRAFHNIHSAREYAETGEGSDAPETLFLKERRVQSEMCRPRILRKPCPPMTNGWRIECFLQRSPDEARSLIIHLPLDDADGHA